MVCSTVPSHLGGKDNIIMKGEERSSPPSPTGGLSPEIRIRSEKSLPGDQPDCLLLLHLSQIQMSPLVAEFSRTEARSPHWSDGTGQGADGGQTRRGRPGDLVLPGWGPGPSSFHPQPLRPQGTPQQRRVIIKASSSQRPPGWAPACTWSCARWRDCVWEGRDTGRHALCAHNLLLHSSRFDLLILTPLWPCLHPGLRCSARGNRCGMGPALRQSASPLQFSRPGGPVLGASLHHWPLTSFQGPRSWWSALLPPPSTSSSPILSTKVLGPSLPSHLSWCQLQSLVSSPGLYSLSTLFATLPASQLLPLSPFSTQCLHHHHCPLQTPIPQSDMGGDYCSLWTDPRPEVLNSPQQK